MNNDPMQELFSSRQGSYTNYVAKSGFDDFSGYKDLTVNSFNICKFTIRSSSKYYAFQITVKGKGRERKKECVIQLYSQHMEAN